MIELKLTNEQLDELYREISENADARSRKKCWAIYLKGHGYAHCDIAHLVRVDADSVTAWLKKYRDGGLPALLSTKYRKKAGALAVHEQHLRALFEQQPPHTVNQALDAIERETGVVLKPSAGRAFLKKLGLKFRKCGLVPGKAADDEAQQRAQQAFHDDTLQPLLDEAKQGRRTVLFVDAAHFVMGAFLGLLWCFARRLLPSSSGRKRCNVLGAYDPIRHKAVVLTNETVVNQETFCAFMEQIAAVYADTGVPLTLVLDNARYQKCASVTEKAKALEIELQYLPPYSPNLNLIERLWRFVKKQVLYSTHYDRFADFKDSIANCLRDLGTRFRDNMETLMTLKFQLFSKSENCTA